MHAFLPEAHFPTTAAKAARHAESTQYDTETFCAVELDAADGRRHIPVHVSAAKYMPPALAVKDMVIVGNGRQLHFDLARDAADLVHRLGAERVCSGDQGAIRAGYEVLVHRLAEGDPETAMDLEDALSVLRVLDEARACFPADLPVWTPQDCAPLPGWFQRRWARAA